MGVCMEPWLGLLNAYATAILHIFQFVKNHATLRVNVQIWCPTTGGGRIIISWYDWLDRIHDWL